MIAIVIKIWFSFKKNILKHHQSIIALVSIFTFILVLIFGIIQSCQTRETLDSARQNYIDENRPFVFPGRPSKDSTKYGFVAHLPIINYGNTPAYKVNRHICFLRSNTILDPRTFKYDSTWISLTLAPNSTDTLDLLQDVQWDNSSTAHFYVVGAIWYNDKWSNVHHYTTFAYEWIYRYGNRFVRLYEYEKVDR